MLHETTDLAAVLARFAPDPLRGFTLRHFCQPRLDGSGPARLLVDSLAAPRVVLAIRSADLVVEGELDALIPAFKNLLAGRVECRGGWPHTELQADWDRHAQRGEQHGAEPSGRYLFFCASSHASWRAARAAGFVSAPPRYPDEDEFLAYQWTWLGEPRFASEVRHPCRIVQPGDFELLELIKQGVPYDPQGEYIRECLSNGPSFVVETEQDGPVSWACTHLSGFMGMLYTPEQHRRKGYARSLWAFQIDRMLAQEGIAACHVLDYNTASMELMHSLGGQPLEEPVVWRTVYWPGDSQPGASG